MCAVCDGLSDRGAEFFDQSLVEPRPLHAYRGNLYVDRFSPFTRLETYEIIWITNDDLASFQVRQFGNQCGRDQEQLLYMTLNLDRNAGLKNLIHYFKDVLPQRSDR